MSNIRQITEHVYWMKPDVPDRPSLCAVVGSQFTLMLDAGASAAHTRLFLDALESQKIPAPRYVVLTHWHWDHVFGASELKIPVIAHTETAQQLATLVRYEWSDAALDQRVASGEEIAFCADNIKLELPAPRQIEIVMPEIIFHQQLEIRLGDVTCTVQHVGGDHAADSCVIYIESDQVLFLGDCLYDAVYAPARHYTTKKCFPLLDALLDFEVTYCIEGHNDQLLTRAELSTMINKMRLAGKLVTQLGTDEVTVFAAAQAQQPLDEDLEYFLRAFIAGIKLQPQNT